MPGLLFEEADNFHDYTSPFMKPAGSLLAGSVETVDVAAQSDGFANGCCNLTGDRRDAVQGADGGGRCECLVTVYRSVHKASLVMVRMPPDQRCIFGTYHAGQQPILRSTQSVEIVLEALLSRRPGFLVHQTGKHLCAPLMHVRYHGANRLVAFVRLTVPANGCGDRVAMGRGIPHPVM